jgi:DNA-directed RNA polymerase
MLGNFQRQLQLETDAIEMGIKRYRDKVGKGDLTNLPPGIRLTKMAIEPMATAMKGEMDETSPGVLAQYRKFYRKFDPVVLAFIVAQRVVQSLGSPRPESFQTVAISIVDRLLLQLDYNAFKKEAPGYVYTIEQDNKWASEGHRRNTLMRAKKKLSGRTEMSREKKLKIGVRLLHIFIASTGLVEEIQLDGYDVNRLMPSQETLEYLEKAHGECELMNPLHYPMVVPPKPWTSPFGGGFVSSHATIKPTLVKTRDREELFHLATQDMPKVYEAINHVQMTGWRINTRVLNVMSELWKVGGVAGLPDKEIPPIPAKPWGLGVPTTEQLIAWKKEATSIYEKHARERSKRVNMGIKLNIANAMKQEQAIYFVWQMDWRGRIYPVQNFVHPQADDTGRSLLEFAEGVPIGGGPQGGSAWLAIHGANCYGNDKGPYSERIAFIHENSDLIIRIANDPIGMLDYWKDADKPFQFLAFCFEWQGFMLHGTTFHSRLPIALDGSCNGLQNFSALLRDEVGGAATNLLPCGEPQDVYQQVADRVTHLLKADIGGPDHKFAEIWLNKVTRKVVKRGVMTTPYGVTQYGMRQQLRFECEKLEKNFLGLPKDVKQGEYYGYLAKHLWTAIGEVVIAARVAMDWLQEASNLVVDTDQIVRWTTPVGFRPKQDYRRSKLTRIETAFGGVRVVYGLHTDTEKIDKRKMKDGIAPNFIHSLDAAHLMLTVNLCAERGITAFGMVHDSFATHAGNASVLAAELREAFIYIYTPPVLELWAAEIFNGTGVELPPIPEMGNLDLRKVREAPYFFG